MAAAFRIFQFGERQLGCDGDVHLMGIVNVTPDSFSGGGHFAEVVAVLARGLELVAVGGAAIALPP